MVNKPSKNKVRSFIQKDIGTTRSAMEAQISRTYAAYAEQMVEVKKANVTVDNHSQSTRIEAPSHSAARPVGKSNRNAPLDMAAPDSPILVQSVSSGYHQHYVDDSFGQAVSERKNGDAGDSTVKGYLNQPATPIVLQHKQHMAPGSMVKHKASKGKRTGSARRHLFGSHTPGQESELFNAVGSQNRSRCAKVEYAT